MEKTKLGLLRVAPACLIFRNEQFYVKSRFSLAARFTERLRGAKTRVTGRWTRVLKSLQAGQTEIACARVRTQPISVCR